MQTYGLRTPPRRANTSRTSNQFRRSSSEISYMQTPSLSYDGTEFDEQSPGRLSQNLSSRVLLDEYTKPGLHLSDQEQAPMILRRTSTLYDEDPVAAHFLVETAIGDSQNFKVLSFDELHNLKKEQDVLSRRIQGIRRNLHLESKVRSAAQSLNRLESRRRGSENRGIVDIRNGVPAERRNGGGSPLIDPFSQTDDQAAASTRKCEDLALELWKLERRLAQLHDKQLQHTAGILHMEHLFRSQERYQSQPGTVDGVPSGNVTNGFPIDRAAPPEDFLNMIDASNSNSSDYHNDLIAVTEKRVQRLQERLRGLVDLASRISHSLNTLDSQKATLPFTPAPSLDEGLDNLDSGFTVLEQKINVQLAKPSTDAIEAKINLLNQQMYAMIDSSRSQLDYSYPPPPNQKEKQSNPTQYLEGGLSTLKQMHGNLADALEMARTREVMGKEEHQHTNSALTSLWEVVKASEEATRQRKLKEGNQDSRDLTIPNEQFSVKAFSEKVERLCNHTSVLADQHTVLRQQINQQREAHSSRETERTNLLTKMQEATDKHVAAQRDLEETKVSHAETELRLADAQKEVSRQKNQLDANAAALANHSDASAQLVKLQGEHSSLKDEISQLKTNLNVSRIDLDSANSLFAKQASELASHKEKLGELESLRALNGTQATQQKAAEDRVEVLQRELRELVGEYEGLVKLSVEGEKEREGLESSLDALREKCEALEISRNEQHVQSMGQTSPSLTNGVVSMANGAKEGTSMSVMKTEFKKMMRDARAEHFKHLKIEQDERRRLEGIIRTLRKEQTSTVLTSSSPPSTSNPLPGAVQTQTSAGKSGLSNSVIAA